MDRGTRYAPEVLVDYVLTRRLADVPDTFSSSQVADFEPRPATRESPSHEDFYSN